MAIDLVAYDRQHVLFNFHQATSLAINSISIEGSVLAPWANVNFIGGQLNGTLISQSVMGIGQANLSLFQGNLPVTPTPEPATWALAAGSAWRSLWSVVGTVAGSGLGFARSSAC